VQEQQRRIGAGALKDVDLAAAKAFAAPSCIPIAHALA
jgi:hypothetical protein